MQLRGILIKIAGGFAAQVRPFFLRNLGASLCISTVMKTGATVFNDVIHIVFQTLGLVLTVWQLGLQTKRLECEQYP